MIGLAAKALLRTGASTALGDEFANLGFRLFRDTLAETRKSIAQRPNPEGHLAMG